jgi:hypothetical protein
MIFIQNNVIKVTDFGIENSFRNWDDFGAYESVVSEFTTPKEILDVNILLGVIFEGLE